MSDIVPETPPSGDGAAAISNKVSSGSTAPNQLEIRIENAKKKEWTFDQNTLLLFILLDLLETGELVRAREIAREMGTMPRKKAKMGLGRYGQQEITGTETVGQMSLVEWIAAEELHLTAKHGDNWKKQFHEDGEESSSSRDKRLRECNKELIEIRSQWRSLYTTSTGLMALYMRAMVAIASKSTNPEDILEMQKRAREFDDLCKRRLDHFMSVEI